MNTPNQSEKLIKKSTTSLSPWVFQIGLSFLFEAKEEDPEIDLNKCLTIIFYNTQKEKQKEEKVQLNSDLSFTVSIPYIKTCYYNYQIGTQIEQGIRKYTYTRNVQQQVDEWEKLILEIIFKIPSIPEELLLSFSVQFGENEQQYFVSKIELKKREQYYESVQQISLRTKFIILKFSNLSMNDQPDSFAELTIDIEKLQNQSNYLVFCPDLYDLNSIFNQLKNNRLKINDMGNEQFQCQFYKINFNEESQKEVNQIQKALCQPIKIGKKRKSEILSLILSQQNNQQKREEDQLTQSVNCLIYTSKKRQNKIKEILSQQHKLNADLLKDTEGNITRIQNYISETTKSESLANLIDEMNSITKQFQDKLNLNETIKSFTTKVSSQAKINQDLTDTLLFFQDKTKQMKSTIKNLAQENKKLEGNQKNQKLLREIYQLCKKLKQNQRKLKESNEKIANLEQQMFNLENDQEQLREHMQQLQIQNFQQSERIQILEQTVDKQLQREMLWIQKTSLQQDCIQSLNEQLRTQTQQNVQSSMKRQQASPLKQNQSQQVCEQIGAFLTLEPNMTPNSNETLFLSPKCQTLKPLIRQKQTQRTCSLPKLGEKQKQK